MVRLDRETATRPAIDQAELLALARDPFRDMEWAGHGHANSAATYRHFFQEVVMEMDENAENAIVAVYRTRKDRLKSGRRNVRQWAHES